MDPWITYVYLYMYIAYTVLQCMDVRIAVAIIYFTSNFL